MVKVKIAVTLDAENPNDNVAISEAKRWKVLQEEGKKQAYLAEQKTVFMAGIYLHALAPELCNKLAQNLASASLEDLQYFSKSIFAKGAEEQQMEGVLDKLSAIQELINSNIEASIALPAADVSTQESSSSPAEHVSTEASSAAPAEHVSIEASKPLLDDNVAEVQAPTEASSVTPAKDIQVALPAIQETELNDKLKKMRKIKSKKLF